MTKPEAMKLLTMLRAAFPRQDLPPETLAVYADNLLDLEAEDAARAVRACLAELKFFPAIAEIRERVARAKLNLPPAELEWEGVRKAIQRHGWTQPRFENPATEAAVNAIGWVTLGMSENIAVERAHFFRIYEAFRGHEGGRIQRGELGPAPTRTGLVAAGQALALVAQGKTDAE